MSVRVMAKVFESDLPPLKRLVMLSLADHAGDDGVCYPSIARLCERTGLSERAIQKHISELESSGHINRDMNAGKRGCNVYTLTPAPCAPPHDVHPAPCEPNPRTVCTPTPARRAPEPSSNHQEPSEERETIVSLRQRAPKPRGDCEAKFDEFWQRYPRKVGKGAARKAYAKAVKAIDHDDLMFALSRQLAGIEAKEPQYRPHPATWLNSERWNDEPEPAHDPRGHMPSRPGSGMVDAFAAVAARKLARDGRG